MTGFAGPNFFLGRDRGLVLMQTSSNYHVKCFKVVNEKGRLATPLIVELLWKIGVGDTRDFAMPVGTSVRLDAARLQGMKCSFALSKPTLSSTTGEKTYDDTDFKSAQC
jgi:hypothetical protein